MSDDYYIVMEGVKCDRKMIELAEGAVAGAGDGRISLDDAKYLLAAVKDANLYTDVEKATMRYVRDNYRFTEAADRWFRTEIRRWAATRSAGEAAQSVTPDPQAAVAEPPAVAAPPPQAVDEPPAVTAPPQPLEPAPGPVCGCLAHHTALRRLRGLARTSRRARWLLEGGPRTSRRCRASRR